MFEYFWLCMYVNDFVGKKERKNWIRLKELKNIFWYMIYIK